MIKKKFPTCKAINYNYISHILEKYGMDEAPIGEPSFWTDFIHKKLYDTVTFPNIKLSDLEPRMGGMIMTESIFSLPKHYDSSNDLEDYNLRKKQFWDNMTEIVSKEELETIKKSQSVNFGPKSLEFANEYLKVIYDELSEYYINDKLMVWMPHDLDTDSHWVTYDYPHKYDLDSDIISPNGVYYLSDIEEYLKKKYGLEDELFYKFIVDNMYIEGRYWERVWYINHDNGILKRLGGKYGMDATENIDKILSVLEKDFNEEFTGSLYKPGLLIYVDYYKKI